jgi:3-hydroxyacyl-CoA dehydrogenase
MPRVEADRVERVAALGAGTMGGGWVACFAARGFAVNVWDPPTTAPSIYFTRPSDQRALQELAVRLRIGPSN